MASRTRNFVFTHNNYIGTELQDTIKCRYIAYAHEVGDQGTPHLQGVVCFKDGITIKTAIRRLPGCHVERMAGSIDQAISYIDGRGKKGGPPYEPDRFTERGDRPMSNDDKGIAERNRVLRLIDYAKEGRMERIEQEDPKLFLRMYNTLKTIRMDYMKAPKDLENVCGIWIHGPTYSGKTHLVKTQFPDRYIKPANKEWNGYQGQEVVHLDEFAPEHRCLAYYIKLWADSTPFHAYVKYSDMLIRPRKFIITSNFTIDEIGFQEKDIEPIKRRFRVIHKEKQEQYWIL